MKNLSIKPIISIIIVSYNCWDYLADCLKSLSFIALPYEVIVVDNHSSDGTILKLRQQFPEVKSIMNDFNAGFSRANNQGFAIATGEFVLILNPDAKLLNADIIAAIDFLKQNPRSIVGAELINSDGSEQDSVFEVSGVKSIAMEALFLSYVIKKSKSEILSQNAFGLSGACLLMYAKSYAEMNGFDNNLFWMEDIDLCVRGRNAGLQIVYFSKWKVMHHVGQSGKKNYKSAIANQLISKLKYLKKHKSWPHLVFAAFFVQLHIVFRLLLFAVLSPFQRKNRLKYFAYWHTQTVFFNYIFTGKTLGF